MLEPTQRHRSSRTTESVLILQGGGSLGAFACGVYGELKRSGISFDIVAGTSIGAVNGAIICGSKSGEPEKDLKDFWEEISESLVSMVPDGFFVDYDRATKEFSVKNIRSPVINAALFGVSKMFTPRWAWHYAISDREFFFPESWTFAYDHTVLERTLSKYVDYEKLAPKQSKNNSLPRLIITAVNVMTAEHLVYDSWTSPIEAKHVLASAAYPTYGFSWIKIDDGVYGWDGALLNNTPLKEVLDASPRNDKNVYIVENYQKLKGVMPKNRMEVVDRTRDITFSDKTTHDIEVTNKMSSLIDLVERLYDILDKADLSKCTEDEVRHVRTAYSDLVDSHGAEILSVKRITREEEGFSYLYKNADFSTKTIRDLIAQGEKNAKTQLGLR